MKIIEKEYINTCSCGTTLVYKKSDLYYSRDYYRYYLTCPTCGETKDSVCYSLFSKEYKNDDKDKEIERLHSIIKEVREYIENNSLYEQDYDYDYEENLVEYPPNDELARKHILEILDKENKEVN